MKAEVRVGLFVVLATAVIVGFVLLLGDVRFGETQVLHVDYAYSGSLQVGAPVKVSGIVVGKVDALNLLNSKSNPRPSLPQGGLGQKQVPLVRATLGLYEEATPYLKANTLFSVGMQGVIGEAFVELSPGGGEMLADGAALRGADAIRLDTMALQLAAMLDWASGLSSLLDGAEQSDSLLAALASLLNTANGVLADEGPALKSMISDASDASSELKHVLATLSTAISGGRLERTMSKSEALLSGLTQELPAVVRDASSAMTILAKYAQAAQDELSPEVLARTLADASEAISELKNISGRASSLLAQFEAGDGTAMALMNDPQIYDDLKELLRDIKRNPWKLMWKD